MSPFRDGGLSDVPVRHPVNAIKHPTPTDSDQGDERDGLLLKLGFERPAERVEVDLVRDHGIDASHDLVEDECGSTGREGGGGVVRHEMMPSTECQQLVPVGAVERTAGQAKSPADTTEHARLSDASHVQVMRCAGNVTLALRVAAFALAVLWWLPTIVMMFSGLAWREKRFRHRLSRVRRLRRAGRIDAAKAALESLKRDIF